MLTHRALTIAALAAATAGCHVGICAKRASEECCPTDIRKTVPWCAGEDAIFHCPCGPSQDFYGHKPTCWRTWPAPAAVWRDSYCSVSVPLQELPLVPDPEGVPPAEPVEPSGVEPSGPPTLPPPSVQADHLRAMQPESLLPNLTPTAKERTDQPVRKRTASAARLGRPPKITSLRPGAEPGDLAGQLEAVQRTSAQSAADGQPVNPFRSGY